MTNTALPLRSLPTRLFREWAMIARRPDALRRARDWQLGIAVTSLDDVVAACGFRMQAERPSASTGERGAAEERVLARLVALARHDDLAARIVLQRLLPGLLSIARRWGRRHGDGVEMVAFDDLVADAWEVIRTFPVERRSDQLAARLLRDAEYRAFIRAGRRLMVTEATPDEHFEALATEPHASALDELADIVAGCDLSDHDRHLLRMVLRGASTTEMALSLRVSERTVRNHRDAMVVRLRAAV